MPHMLAMFDDVMGRSGVRRRQVSHRALMPLALGMEGAARVFRIEPDGHARDVGDGQEAHVFQQRQGEGGAGLCRAPGTPGLRRRGRLVPRAGAVAGMIALAAVAALTWVYLLLLHGRFWSAGRSSRPSALAPAPPLDVVVPARDEADGIEPALRSLLAQDYPGRCGSRWSTTAAPTAPASSPAPSATRACPSSTVASAPRAGAANSGQCRKGWTKAMPRSCC